MESFGNSIQFSQVWDVPWRWWKLQWRWYFSFYSCFKQQIQETSPANLGAHSLAQGMSQSLFLANMVRPRQVWGHEDHFVCRQICSPQGLQSHICQLKRRHVCLSHSSRGHLRVSQHGEEIMIHSLNKEVKDQLHLQPSSFNVNVWPWLTLSPGRDRRRHPHQDRREQLWRLPRRHNSEFEVTLIQYTIPHNTTAPQRFEVWSHWLSYNTQFDVRWQLGDSRAILRLLKTRNSLVQLQLSLMWLLLILGQGVSGNVLMASFRCSDGLIDFFIP